MAAMTNFPPFLPSRTPTRARRGARLHPGAVTDSDATAEAPADVDGRRAPRRAGRCGPGAGCWSPARRATSAAAWWASCSTPATGSGAWCGPRPSSAAPPGSTGSRSCRATCTATSPTRSRASTRCTTWCTRSAGRATGSSRTGRRPRTSATQATEAGVRRIVYLGGLGDDATEQLSPHLASRHEVGRVLADGPVPVTELRAAVIIGSGSASFEMLRYLVEVLPVMVTPKWVETRCQPIAVRDVLRYLVGVLAEPRAAGPDPRGRRPRRPELPPR